MSSDIRYVQEELPKQTDIVPAVLPSSFEDLRNHLELVHTKVRAVQIDVVDGDYAHGKTWPYKDSASFEKIVAEEHGLPFWDALDFEFDLMIQHPELEVQRFVQAGATRIILHAKSAGVLTAYRLLLDMREDGGVFSVKIGIALMPDAQPEDLEPFEAAFDFVQVMGVERIGRQGEPFDKRAVYLVERLRARYPDLVLQVDGGVNKENAQVLVAAGVNRLIVGSAIFEATDPGQAIDQLRAIVKK